MRCVILNGSTACGKIKGSSDIDLLIIAEKRRVFTARAFCVFLVYLSGRKRSSDDHKSHRGRLCLNYFLTSGYLMVPHNRSYEMNKYCAENYSGSVLLAGNRELFEKFMKVNESWMSKYPGKNSKFLISNVKSNPKSQKTMEQWDSGTIQKVTEYVLVGNLGNRLEAWLKKVQLSRINHDPRTSKYPDLIVANDREMRFHPPKN